MKKIIICIFIAFIAFSFFYQMGCAQERGGIVLIGKQAADFTLLDIEGKNTGLKDFIGKNVVLLVFSTTRCPYCNKEIPELKKLHDRYNEKGVKILGIYIGESKNKLADFVKSNDIPYTILSDSNGVVAKQYGVFGVPTLIVIDKKGVIREKVYPPLGKLITLFEKLLQE